MVRRGEPSFVTTHREGASVLEARRLGLLAAAWPHEVAVSVPAVGVVITQDDISKGSLIKACQLRTGDLVNSVLDSLGYEYPDVDA